MLQNSDTELYELENEF